MENHPSRSGSRSRSHHRRHHSSAVFSKKLTEAHSFGRRVAYDDLCSGPRKFGAPTASSRVDDYNEIFNSSRASRGSSIPVLDLPDVDERECPGPGRFRSSEIDYSKIFGGLSDADFGSTYGELFAGPKGGETSSDETWTPAETGSPSEDSDSFNSYEAPHQVNGKKQFNMSYHKTNQRSRDGTNGTTHIAELHAVPGFTCVIDEETPLRNSKENRQIPPIIRYATLNRNVSEGTISGKHIRRAASDFQNRRVSRTTSDGDVKFHSGPCGNTILLDADEINLKKHPTKGPSLSNMSLDNRKRGSYRSMSANLESFESARSSPQFSDEEVDVNSAAAASAIALRKAIAEAQASIRIAKESMERKTGGFDNSFRSSFKDNLKAKAKREGPIAGKAEVLNEKPCETCERVDIAEQVFDGMERPNARKTGSMAPNFRDRIDLSRAKEAPEGTNDRDYISILAGHRLDRAAEREGVEHFHGISRTSKGKAATLVSKQAERKGKIVQSVDEHEQKEKKIVEKTFQLLVGNSEKIKTAAEVHELKKTEEKLSAVPMVKQLEEHVKGLNLRHGVNDQIENKKKFRVFPEQEDLKAFCAGKKLEERLENSFEPVDAKELEVQQLVDNKNESRLKEAQEPVKNEKQFGVAHKQDDIKEGVVEVANFGQHEENLEEIHGHEIEKKPKEDCECGEVYEERVVEASGWEENKEPNCSYEEEYHEGGLQEVLRQDVDEGKLTDAYDDKESDNRQEEYCEWEGNVKLKDPQKHEGNENVPEVAYLMEKDDERLQEDAQEWEEIHGMGTETCQSEGNGTTMKSDLDTLTHEESILKADTDACDGDEYVNPGQSEESCKDGEKIKELEVDDCIRRILDGTKASRDLEHSEELKEVDLEDVLDEREDLESAGLAQDDLKCDDALPFDKIDLKEDNMNFEGKQINGNMGHGTSACDQKEWVETMAHELGGDVRHAQEAEVSFARKADDNDFGAVDGKGVEIGKDVGTTLLPCMFDGEKEIMGKDEEIGRNQTTEEDEKNTNETTVREQPEIEKVLQKVVEVDGKNLKKMNAEKAKEREREKDRLAVERAIREARERAFAEARERAERAAVERATAEALQREKAKAQGRFEKASAEAKSLAGKASEEAKLKAQRAAVERATSEARERALQRALSEKSSSAGNEHANRFSTEKLSGISRDNGAKHKFPSSDSQAQGPSSSSKSSNSSCHGAPNATERFDGARGESAQRCQAKLERHQRTVERAAKALAEKNMRDLLAQKEQAERNRLAAGLDAEVKRWSSGKLGNLRALLSTLQYILSSDSGWQSIPLTDMVTTSAVKKAYRKAALCVHPDKLQQRGASIQQKYICEKVFDLLKDAWNKFNSEER